MDPDFSGLLSKLDAGDRASLNECMPVVYAELRRLAGLYMVRERSNHTLQPTALVHEAYLRMVGQRSLDWENRAHVMAIGARMMRRVLLDHAASVNADKRGGQMMRITLSDAFSIARLGSVDLIDLDRSLKQLATIDPQQAAVVELRFFGGLTDMEIAAVLKVSEVTVRRRWASARLWLARQLAGGRGNGRA